MVLGSMLYWLGKHAGSEAVRDGFCFGGWNITFGSGQIGVL